MQINELLGISEIDLENNLLLNYPVEIPEVGFLHQLTLKEMLNVKFSKYYSFIYYLTLDIVEIQNSTNIDEDVDPYDFLFINFCLNEDILNLFIDGFTWLFKEDVTVNLKDKYFIIGEYNIITKLTYTVIADIVRKIHNIKPKNNIEKPKNDKQKEYRRILAEKRKKYANYLKSDEPSFSDIISSLANKHPSINLFNIQDLTWYQITHSLKRLDMIEKYENNMNFLSSGNFDSKSIELKHWTGRIN